MLTIPLPLPLAHGKLARPAVGTSSWHTANLHKGGNSQQPQPWPQEMWPQVWTGRERAAAIWDPQSASWSSEEVRGQETQVCHLTVWSWARYFTGPSLSFTFCKRNKDILT